MYIVGVGLGDSDLLMIKVVKCLEKVDVILYDWLVNFVFF